MNNTIRSGESRAVDGLRRARLHRRERVALGEWQGTGQVIIQRIFSHGMGKNEPGGID